MENWPLWLNFKYIQKVSSELHAKSEILTARISQRSKQYFHRFTVYNTSTETVYNTSNETVYNTNTETVYNTSTETVCNTSTETSKDERHGNPDRSPATDMDNIK